MDKAHKHTDYYKVYRITEKESIYEKTLGETYYEIVFENMNNKKKIKTEVAVGNLNFEHNGWFTLIQIEKEFKHTYAYSFKDTMINRKDHRKKPKKWHTFVNPRDNTERINADSQIYPFGEIEIQLTCHDAIQETDDLFTYDKEPEIKTREVVNTDIWK